MYLRTPDTTGIIMYNKVDTCNQEVPTRYRYIPGKEQRKVPAQGSTSTREAISCYPISLNWLLRAYDMW